MRHVPGCPSCLADPRDAPRIGMGPSPTLLTLLLNPSLTSHSRFRMGLDLTFPPRIPRQQIQLDSAERSPGLCWMSFH